MKDTRPILEILRELALDHQGVVTTQQAVEVGINKVEPVKLASRGRIERLGHGIYRIPGIPVSPWENWAYAVLWANDERAVLSHETALAAWNITDINPDKIHITVPKHKRIRKQGGENFIIHHADLADSQMTFFEQIPITDIPTTIKDCINWGVPTYLIKQAFGQTNGTSKLTAQQREKLEQQLERRDNGE
jgi:predicted transcriptional regulator of viral defense system